MSQTESGARDNRTARPRYSRRYLRRTCPIRMAEAKL